MRSSAGPLCPTGPNLYTGTDAVAVMEVIIVATVTCQSPEAAEVIILATVTVPVTINAEVPGNQRGTTVTRRRSFCGPPQRRRSFCAM